MRVNDSRQDAIAQPDWLVLFMHSWECDWRYCRAEEGRWDLSLIRFLLLWQRATSDGSNEGPCGQLEMPKM